MERRSNPSELFSVNGTNLAVQTKTWKNILKIGICKHLSNEGYF